MTSELLRGEYIMTIIKNPRIIGTYEINQGSIAFDNGVFCPAPETVG
jgi:hypothetical protein